MRIVLPVICLLFLFNGCCPTEPAIAGMNEADRSFAASNAAHYIIATQVSTLAKEKATDDRVRTHAVAGLAIDSTLQRQLQIIAGDLVLNLSTVPDAQFRELYNNLVNTPAGNSFDSTFASANVKMLQHRIDIVAAHAATGINSRLKAYGEFIGVKYGPQLAGAVALEEIFD